MDRGSDLMGIIPKLVWFTSAGYEKTFKSPLTSTITRRFNAGVEKKRFSASLLVSYAHVNPATRGSNCRISRWRVVTTDHSERYPARDNGCKCSLLLVPCCTGPPPGRCTIAHPSFLDAMTSEP